MNAEVTHILEEKKHKSIELINAIRKIILDSDKRIKEIWKWNGPSYTCNTSDIITIKIFPETKPVSIIFHAGIKTGSNIKSEFNQALNLQAEWRGNDRVVYIVNSESDLRPAPFRAFICKWIELTM